MRRWVTLARDAGLHRRGGGGDTQGRYLSLLIPHHVPQGYIVAAEVAVRWGVTGLRVAVQSVSSLV